MTMKQEFKTLICPTCSNKITYCTTRDHIMCQLCKTKIPVEPMEPIEPDPEVERDGISI